MSGSVRKLSKLGLGRVLGRRAAEEREGREELRGFWKRKWA